MSDLVLPVSRCPGIIDTAQECLGLDPWAVSYQFDPRGRAVNSAWWADNAPVVPPHIPAGRLVAETWMNGLDRAGWNIGEAYLANPGAPSVERTRTVCLWMGAWVADLLTLCKALDDEVPAGTVPRLEPVRGGWAVCVGETRRVFLYGAERGEITDPREALTAILAEVQP